MVGVCVGEHAIKLIVEGMRIHVFEAV